MEIPLAQLTNHEKRRLEKQRKKHRILKGKQSRKLNHKLKIYKRGRVNRTNQNIKLIRQSTQALLNY